MKKIFSLFLLVTLSLSCVSSYQSTKKSGNYYRYEGNKDNAGMKAADRIIVKNGTIDLLVKEPDSIYKQLDKIAIFFGGYISSSSNSYATLKVKSANLEDALEELSELGKVKDKSISTQDITTQYTDYKIRLENAEKARERYLELLKQAKDVSEILPLEKEIQRLTAVIEQMKGAMKLMDDQVVYSAIKVYWQKKTKPGPIGYVFVGLYKAVRILFVRN